MPSSESELVLKELQDLEKEELKRKRELEKLKQKIEETTKQAKEQQEFDEKVPIKQVAAITVEGLSAEEKAIIATYKKSKGDLKETEKEQDSLEKKTNTAKKDSLEWAIESEAINSRFGFNIDEQRAMQDNYQQIVDLSQKPISQLYDQMKNIYDSTTAQGYVSRTDAAQTFELESAIERKLQDVDLGNYQFTNEQTAKAASASLSMKEKVSAMYVAGKNTKSGNDLYQ